MIKVDKMDDYKKENIFRAVVYTDDSNSRQSVFFMVPNIVQLMV